MHNCFVLILNRISPYYCIVFVLLTKILVRGYNKFHYLNFTPVILQDSAADPHQNELSSFARIYHPDKHSTDLIGMSPNQAEEYFKLVNNAYNFLRLDMKWLKHEVPKKGKCRLNSFNTRDDYYYYYYYYSPQTRGKVKYVKVLKPSSTN